MPPVGQNIFSSSSKPWFCAGRSRIAKKAALCRSTRPVAMSYAAETRIENTFPHILWVTWGSRSILTLKIALILKSPSLSNLDWNLPEQQQTLRPNRFTNDIEPRKRIVCSAACPQPPRFALLFHQVYCVHGLDIAFRKLAMILRIKSSWVVKTRCEDLQKLKN